MTEEVFVISEYVKKKLIQQERERVFGKIKEQD